MKKVFSNSQCCHVWAQQSQDEGRGHNTFFEKESIYSYGRHFKIAQFIKPRVVLFNDSSYSSSTNKHQSYVRGALRGLDVEVIRVPVIADGKYKDDVQKCCDKMMNCAEGDIKRAIRAVTRTDFYKEIAKGWIERLEQYLMHVKGMTPKQWARLRSIKKMLESDDFTKLMPIIKEENEAQRKRTTERRLFDEEQARQKELKNEERLKEWLNGNDVYISNCEQNKTYLRIKNDEVQTSRGARVQLSDAKNLLSLWKTGEVPIGWVIGHYTVEEVGKDRIKIGCHYLLREEIERIAPQLEAA